jgi:hypothetical protein
MRHHECISRRPLPVDPQLITFQYVCGTKYRVRNAGTRLVDVSYQVFHVTGRGELTVPANGEACVIAHHPYAVALCHQGQAIRDAQNGQVPFPP